MLENAAQDAVGDLEQGPDTPGSEVDPPAVPENLNQDVATDLQPATFDEGEMGNTASRLQQQESAMSENSAQDTDGDRKQPPDTPAPEVGPPAVRDNLNEDVPADLPPGISASRSAQQESAMPENSAQDAVGEQGPGIPAPEVDPPAVPENLNQDVAAGLPGPLDANLPLSSSIWLSWARFKNDPINQLRVWATRLAMFFCAILALCPVVDILTDLLTAATFARRGHPWWASITLVVLYLSSRFTVLFMALSPTPSVRNLLRLYIPGRWSRVKNSEPRSVANREQRDDVLHSRGEGSVGTRDGDEVDFFQIQVNRQLANMTRNGFTKHLMTILTEASIPGYFWRSLYVVLKTEIMLLWFACLAIMPIGTWSCSLSASYLNVAGLPGFARLVGGPWHCPRLPRSVVGMCWSFETPAPDSVSVSFNSLNITGPYPGDSNNEARKQANLYLQTVAIVEAVLESCPQLLLAVRAGIVGGELTEWVFVLSVSVSAICIAKATAGYVLNRKAIKRTLLYFQGHVVRFTVLPSSKPHPGRPWTVATAEEVADNEDLLPDPTKTVVEWNVAKLAKNMEICRGERHYDVQHGSGNDRGHTLYSFK